MSLGIETSPATFHIHQNSYTTAPNYPRTHRHNATPIAAPNKPLSNQPCLATNQTRLATAPAEASIHLHSTRDSIRRQHLHPANNLSHPHLPEHKGRAEQSPVESQQSEAAEHRRGRGWSSEEIQRPLRSWMGCRGRHWCRRGVSPCPHRHLLIHIIATNVTL